ncbi:MAG: S41 family peptidase [Methanoregulaceae archaeon]|nr:S41 family peptidase [Methanoregulaceae archaeon]
MKSRVVQISIIVAVMLVFTICAFGGGYAIGQITSFNGNLFANLRNSETPVTTGVNPEEEQSLFAPFWEAWDIAHEEYLEQPLDDNALMEGAIRGMLEAIGDPYTSYLDPAETDDINTAMAGEYEGIGALVDTDGEYLTIISPMKGYPAEEAGLLTGDKILMVDGEDVSGMDPDLVRLTKVMGPAGTQLVLTIQREGIEEPFEVELTRAHIVVPSVDSEVLEGGIGYIQVSMFGENTASETHDILAELLGQGVQGIILDLRFNAGGFTDAATRIASEFIGEGVIWYEEYGDGTLIPYEAIPGGLALDVPLVVLVNEGSASASELLTGALQDHERAVVVGVTSFGKGLVQSWLPISNGGMVTVTIARWLTPDERSIHGEGITPDVVVEITEQDLSEERDPQLDMAIQEMLRLLNDQSQN